MAQQLTFPEKVTREKINFLIDRAADLIRTAVDYKFILVLLFLKRLNDIWEIERQQVKQRLIKKAGLTEKETEKELDKEDYYTFYIPKQFQWNEITRDVKRLPEKLATAISEIAKVNKELQGVIDRVDFLEFARNQENKELLRQLVELFNKYNLGGEEVSPDVLGDAYEHLVMKFAPQKAKEGEIYTPREVIKLMVEILDPTPGESVYDPCCGSGGMLIGSYSHVAEKYGEKEVQKLFLNGQERNPTIYAICEMNLILHDIKHGDIIQGDTLDNPKLREDDKLKVFDIVIANPPWNQDGYGEDRLKRANFRERFPFGYTPNDKADWAWIQHMLASSKEKVAIVLDQGALFRGGSEGNIRKQIIEKDWIECVILLPPKLFYNTGASGIIIILNKNKSRTRNRKDKILFINAVEKFEKHPEVRRLNTITSNNIGKITKAYENFKTIAGFTKVADLNTIKEKDYNLNITLYAPLIEEEEEVNIKEVYKELEALREDRSKTEKAIKGYVEGILKPLK